MRIAAGERDARLREAEFGADYVHDALLRIVHAEAADAVFGAVQIKQANHFARVGVDHIGEAFFAAAGGHVVIGGGEALARFAHLAPLFGQRTKGVKRAVVQQIAVDVEQRFAALVDDHVLLPDFFEQRLRYQIFHNFPFKTNTYNM